MRGRFRRREREIVMKRTLAVFGVAGALVLGTAGVSSAQARDAWITMKTKIALMTSEGVSATGLNVDTTKGMVTLHGKVESQPEKLKAESVAKSIEGVKEVKNLLQVVPPSSAPVVEARDEDLKTHVESAFKHNTLLADSGINVASVNKGVVLLTGKTNSLEALLRAVEVAKDVRGVRRVSSDVVAE
jgi:osmotically-inducible protein OsmY